MGICLRRELLFLQARCRLSVIEGKRRRQRLPRKAVPALGTPSPSSRCRPLPAYAIRGVQVWVE